MATTMKLIGKNVLGSNTASVTFSDIPGTYTDLLLCFSTRASNNQTVTGAQLEFNGSTTGYSERLLYGNGSSALSASTSGSFLTWCGLTNAATSTSSTFSSNEVYIPNYAGSANKSVSSIAINENNATAANIYANAGLWSNTAAITSIKITCGESGNFVSGSSFFLYGITRSDDNSPGTFGIQATGGDVTISGGYKYHVFKSSGTFNVAAPGWVEYLVVGGGAGGGRAIGGGGGGGGMLYGNTFLRNNSYNVQVGAGGTGGTASVITGVNGSDSSISSILSYGGGGGGGYNIGGVTGGSGGGAGGDITGTGGLSISGQGNNGATTGAASPRRAGGGGGKGSAGVSGSSTGNGGSGEANSITGSSVVYAAGGGGGAYTGVSAGAGTTGVSGNGNNVTSGAGGNGTANTGGGGGGGAGSGSGDGNGGNGGSGIVIIRYPVS